VQKGQLAAHQLSLGSKPQKAKSKKQTEGRRVKDFDWPPLDCLWDQSQVHIQSSTESGPWHTTGKQHKANRRYPTKGKQKVTHERQTEGKPVQEAHWLPIGILLDHGQVGVQADAHCGVKGHLESGPVVLGADHGPQLLAVHSLLDLLEELLEGLLVGVCLELQSQARKGD